MPFCLTETLDMISQKAVHREGDITYRVRGDTRQNYSIGARLKLRQVVIGQQFLNNARWLSAHRHKRL